MVFFESKWSFPLLKLLNRSHFWPKNCFGIKVFNRNRSCFSLVQIGPENGPELIQNRSRKWSKNDPKMVQKLFKNGRKMVQKYEIGLKSSSKRPLLHQKSFSASEIGSSFWDSIHHLESSFFLSASSLSL